MTWAVYRAYFKACGLHTVFGAGCAMVIYTAADVGTSIWLSLWSSDPPPGFIGNSTEIDNSLRDLRLGMYGGFGGLQGMKMFLCLKTPRQVSKYYTP